MCVLLETCPGHFFKKKEALLAKKNYNILFDLNTDFYNYRECNTQVHGMRDGSRLTVSVGWVYKESRSGVSAL